MKGDTYLPTAISTKGAAIVLQCSGCRQWMVIEVPKNKRFPLSVECGCGYITETVNFVVQEDYSGSH